MRRTIVYTSFLLSAAAVLVASCTHGIREDLVPSSEPFEAHLNVVYGTDAVQQAMDVYLPVVRDTANTPVVILLHGGAWVRGDKADFAGLGLDTFFTSKGFALINMNYRLDDAYRYPAPVDDVGLVMNYIRQNAADWKINPNRVCLFGRSVGSQLALLYAYSRNEDHRIKAVVDGFGPTDLTDSSVAYTALGFNVTFLLGSYGSNLQAWRDNSPINYLGGAVPTLIFQGTADSLVYPIQSQMLYDSLQARSVPSIYASWVGDGHGWPQYRWLQWRDTTAAWIKRFL